MSNDLILAHGEHLVDWLAAGKIALALGLGLLVGFQRERTAPHVAGIRTFALITMFGTLVGLFSNTLGGWVVVAGILALTSMIVVVNIMRFSGSQKEPGLTTQVAALLMYAVGVTIARDQMALGVLVAGAVAVLLQWKQQLHGFVERIGEKDASAIFRLVLIGLVVLPLLPDKDYGPYWVINPYEIWLMVVLICGISMGSFLASRFLGPRAGTVLGGILGGLISSTATTVSYSRRSRNAPEAAGLASLVIMVASTVVFGRVLLEVAIVAPTVWLQLVPPLVVMMVLMFLISAAMYLSVRQDKPKTSQEGDPLDLKSALLFGVLYAAVLFAVAVVKEHFGDKALYGVAALSGLTDMDAITLSTAQMIKAERLTVDTGWRMILVGAMSNLFFKSCAVAILGNLQLLRRIVLVFGLSLIGGAFLLMFWP